jgi:hypothetical protein
MKREPFNLPLFPEFAAAPIEPEWIQLSAPFRKGGTWRHSSGWLVRHCGHFFRDL